MSCHVLADRFTFAWEQVSSKVRKQVTIQQVVSREAFWHVFCQTPITEVDFKCVLARNCEGTEQLRKQDISPAEAPPVFPVSYFSFVPGYRMFFTFSLPVSEYPGVHLFILLCRIVPGIILCHAPIDDLVPFAFAVIVYPFSVADRI